MHPRIRECLERQLREVQAEAQQLIEDVKRHSETLNVAQVLLTDKMDLIRAIETQLSDDPDT